MIRYYGLYATSNHVHKEKISEILKKLLLRNHLMIDLSIERP